MTISRSVPAAVACLVGCCAGAHAQLFAPPGHYSGTWNNTTFLSTGPIKADCVTSGNNVTMTIDPGGNVLGMIDPPPFTLSGPITGAGWSASIVGHVTMGDIQVNVTPGGAVTVTGTNVPGGVISGYTATGTFTAQGVLTLNSTINFTVGPPAAATISATRTVYSALGSPSQIAQGWYGLSVAGIGDLGVDTRGDLLIGAPKETQFGLAEAGRVHVVNGFGNALIRTLNSPAAEAGGHFGWSVGAVPDTTGDGKPEIVVGAPDEDPGTSPDGAGRAYLFNGATGALIFKLFPSPAETGGKFGWSVAGVPDVNGDGVGDIIVGSPSEDPGAAPTDAGRVYVFSGATGLKIWKLAAIAPAGQAADFFGFSVAGLPDANGDGRGDIVVGMPQSLDSVQTGRFGVAFIFSGATGLRLRTLNSPTGEANGRFGWSVGGIPDANGDGRGDVIVGAPEEVASPLGAGRAHMYSGTNGVLIRTFLPPTPTAGGHFGFSVAGTGDLSGDGRGDVVIGAPGEGSADQGRAYLFSGANGAAVATLASRYTEAGGNFGASVGAVPSVNGGAPPLFEVIVGAPNEDPGTAPASCGRAYLFRR